MGRRGPPPKPPEQKRLEGTERPDRDAAAPDVPQAVSGAPARPAGLSADAAAIWDETAPLLDEMGTLAKTDRGVLEAYCRNLSRARQLDKLAQEKPTLRVRKGVNMHTVLHPAGIEARKLWPVVQKLATDLGLSYAARSRTPPPKKPNESDPVENFLFPKAPLTVVK